MRLKWMNNKTITVVLAIACVATYTAVQSVAANVDEPLQNGFVATMLDAEASLYSIDVSQTQKAQQQLSEFVQHARLTLTAPLSHDDASLRKFALHADRLIQASFPMSRETLSVTESLAQQKGSQTLHTWLLLSTARQFGIESSLSPQQGHAHVILKKQDDNWLEWKLNHLQDTHVAELRVLDEYDLWTAFDLALIKHYVDAGLRGNDDSIEALAKAALPDDPGFDAQNTYNIFVASRSMSSEFVASAN